jgi:hypothetical protein
LKGEPSPLNPTKFEAISTSTSLRDVSGAGEVNTLYAHMESVTTTVASGAIAGSFLRISGTGKTAIARIDSPGASG